MSPGPGDEPLEERTEKNFIKRGISGFKKSVMYVVGLGVTSGLLMYAGDNLDFAKDVDSVVNRVKNTASYAITGELPGSNQQVKVDGYEVDTTKTPVDSAVYQQRMSFDKWLEGR